MELAERRIGDIVVVSIGGTLTSSDAAELRQAMTTLIEHGAPKVVLDLAELRYLDSLGLGELVACQLRAIKARVKLRVANPDARVQDLLLVTRLITVFEAYDSLAAALESFEEDPTV
jgi:anti-sigma B factor antagonist